MTLGIEVIGLKNNIRSPFSYFCSIIIINKHNSGLNLISHSMCETYSLFNISSVTHNQASFVPVGCQ